MPTTRNDSDQTIEVQISSEAVEQAHYAITDIIRAGGLDPRDYWTVAAHMIEVLAIATALLGSGKDRDTIVAVLQQLLHLRITDLTDPATVIIHAQGQGPMGNA